MAIEDKVCFSYHNGGIRVEVPGIYLTEVRLSDVEGEVLSVLVRAHGMWVPELEVSGNLKERIGNGDVMGVWGKMVGRVEINPREPMLLQYKKSSGIRKFRVKRGRLETAEKVDGG